MHDVAVCSISMAYESDMDQNRHFIYLINAAACDDSNPQSKMQTFECVLALAKNRGYSLVGGCTIIFG